MAGDSRFFSIIFYPESIDNDAIYRFGIEQGIQSCYILHDKDIWTENEIKERRLDIDLLGTLKKPHYHMILAFNGTTTLTHVKKLAKEYFNTSQVQWIQYLATPNSTNEGYYYYLTHTTSQAIKDGKTLYNDFDIGYLNGFDITNFEMTSEAWQIATFKIFREHLNITNCDNLIDLLNLYSYVDDVQMILYIKNNINLICKCLDHMYQWNKKNGTTFDMIISKQFFTNLYKL